jgi:hypothetical protein
MHKPKSSHLHEALWTFYTWEVQLKNVYKERARRGALGAIDEV